MDKYEYKLRSEEIVSLIEKEKYEEAVKIADTIDWRRVKSITMLLRIAYLYRANHRNEDAREILLLAYDRYPTNRSVLYCLCEISIELDDVVSAIEHYKEFVKQAPRDNGVFTLRYKILEAQEASLEERIEILEELKKRDYQEEWAYELAYLYHRVGLSTKCVEECDDLILWFGDGPYVKKAMELKMLHAPLTSIQEKKYNMMQNADSELLPNEEVAEEEIPTSDIEEKNYYPEESPVPVPVPVPVEINRTEERQSEDLSQYNTINLQKVVAESMRELFPDDEDIYAANKKEVEDIEYASKKFAEVNLNSEVETETSEEDAAVEEAIPVEEAKSEEILDEGVSTEETTEENLIQASDEVEELVDIEDTDACSEEEDTSTEIEKQRVKEEDIYFETNKIQIVESIPDENQNISRVAKMISDVSEIKPEENAGAIKTVFVPEQKFEPVKPAVEDFMIKDPAIVGEKAAQESALAYQDIQEDTQEEQVPFKPMTGQMNIEDVLKEWERLKEENEQKRKENVRELVMQQTGQIMADFDAALKDIEEEEIEPIQEIEEYTSEDIPQEINEEIKDETLETEEAVGEDILDEEVSDDKEINDGTSNEVYNDETIEETESEETLAEEDYTEETYGEETGEENTEIEQEPVEETMVSMNTTEIENLAEKIEETTKKQTTVEASPELRNFTEDEAKLFENFAVTKKIKKQIINTLDHMSLASYTGNIIITGEADLGPIELSKNLLKVFKSIEPDFTGKTAKITGKDLNDRNVSEIFEKLRNGCLIVESANGLLEKTIFDMTRLLNQEDFNMIVILVDTRKGMQRLLNKQAMVADYFNLRIDLVEMDNNSLVNYAKNYAFALEYSIDELAILALHTRIERLQSGKHVVTKDEVKEIVDEAIWKSKKSKFKNFVDIIFAKRYDDQDMIVLRERDFM